MLFAKSIVNKFKFLVIRILTPTILVYIFDFLPRKKATLLIIKNDGIGDYVLFRNYLEFLKTSTKYRHYKIYLLTSPINKELAVFLDSKYIDGCFLYSDDYFLKWKLLKLIFNLQTLRIHTIIYPNYSRKHSVDWLVNNIIAKEKIAVDGDTVNQSQLLKGKGNKYYTEILKFSAAHLHEFERNKQIMEVITQQRCDFIKPFINSEKLNIQPSQSIVVFPGGSEHAKKWSSLNYNTLCRMISLELNMNIVLAGGNDAIEDGKVIQKGHNETQIKNKIGKLNLIELCEVIANCKLLISNDTVAIHIAATLNVPAVCIAKGDFYGRFIPYPSSIYNKIRHVFPRNFTTDNQFQDQFSKFNIDDVLLDDVYSAVVNTLE